MLYTHTQHATEFVVVDLHKACGPISAINNYIGTN